MKNTGKWNLIKLIAVGSLAVLEFLIGIPIYIIFGGSSNLFVFFITFISGSFFVVLVAKLISPFGGNTLKSFIVNIFCIPLPRAIPTAFTFIWIIKAFIIDVLNIFIKKHKLILGGIDSLLTVIVVYFVFRWLGLPGSEKHPAFLFTPIGLLMTFSIIFIIGLLGGFFAQVIFERLKNTSNVRRILK